MPPVVELTLTRIMLNRAILQLMRAMRHRPGPYPDADTPIAKWQMAHEHLVAARELLADEQRPLLTSGQGVRGNGRRVP